MVKLESIHIFYRYTASEKMNFLFSGLSLSFFYDIASMRLWYFSDCLAIITQASLHKCIHLSEFELLTYTKNGLGIDEVRP